MSQDTLNALMMASIEGPSVPDFPYENACKLWGSLRNRKITLNFDTFQDAQVEIESDLSDDEIVAD